MWIRNKSTFTRHSGPSDLSLLQLSLPLSTSCILYFRNKSLSLLPFFCVEVNLCHSGLPLCGVSLLYSLIEDCSNVSYLYSPQSLSRCDSPGYIQWFLYWLHRSPHSRHHILYQPGAQHRHQSAHNDYSLLRH